MEDLSKYQTYIVGPTKSKTDMLQEIDKLQQDKARLIEHIVDACCDYYQPIDLNVCTKHCNEINICVTYKLLKEMEGQG